MVERLIVGWLDRRRGSETFRSFCDRHTDEELGVLIGREPARSREASKPPRRSSMSTTLTFCSTIWKAGELSVEFEGQEPEDLLEWAIDRFGGRLALSTAFQEGDVALIDMAYRRPGRAGVLDRHRPSATGDARPDRAAPRALRGLRIELISPDAAGAADGRPARAEPVLSSRSRTGSSAATSARCSR